MNANISVSKTALATFCRENGITKLAVFGSALEDDFGPNSDIDVLVEFEPHRVPGLLGIAEVTHRISNPLDIAPSTASGSSVTQRVVLSSSTSKRCMAKSLRSTASLA